MSQNARHATLQTQSSFQAGMQSAQQYRQSCRLDLFAEDIPSTVRYLAQKEPMVPVRYSEWLMEMEMCLDDHQMALPPEMMKGLLLVPADHFEHAAE